MKMHVVLSGMILLAITAAVGAGPSLISNGGFESSPTPGGSGWIAVPAGSADITGWTVGGPDADAVDVVSTLWQQIEGSKSIDLNGTGNGWVQQSVATVAGDWYELTFALSGNPYRTGTKSVQISADSSSTSFDFTALNSTGDMMWEYHTWKFQATDASTAIQFLSTTTPDLNGCGPVIDDVSLVSVVPVPGALLLAGIGTALVGWVRSRRS